MPRSQEEDNSAEPYRLDGSWLGKEEGKEWSRQRELHIEEQKRLCSVARIEKGL